MNDRSAGTWRAIVSGPALVHLAAALVGAQSTRASRAGTVEHIKVHGAALEGDTPDRDVTIYLPPSH
jgi:S-formylglutathione hydrolase